MAKNPAFKPRILLVDDDEHIVRSLEVYLKMEEFQVVTADCGLEALKKVELEMPDLLLLDVMMPGMDGFEVLRRLRENEKTKGLPVIMLTAKDQDMDILKGYQLGAASYMTKPFNLTELVENINLFFEGRRAAAEASLPEEGLDDDEEPCGVDAPGDEEKDGDADGGEPAAGEAS